MVRNPGLSAPSEIVDRVSVHDGLKVDVPEKGDINADVSLEG